QNTGSLTDHFPEGGGRGSSGDMSFDRACDAGLEQVTQHTRGLSDPPAQHKRAFLYARDVHDIQDNQQIGPAAAGDEDTQRARAAYAEDIELGDLSDVEGGAFGSGASAAVRRNVPEPEEQRAPTSPTPSGGARIRVGDITGARGVAVGPGASAEVV